MSGLLIPCEPLQVLPSLAKAIGLNEAIFLQQLHYWLLRSKHERDGRLWVYNTLEQWREQFPFWSARTIRRVVSNLADSGLLVVNKGAKSTWDKTNWYSVDYEALGKLVAPSKGPTCPDRGANLASSYKDQEITTENTTTPLPPKPKRSHKPPEPPITLAPPHHGQEFLDGLERYTRMRIEMKSPLTPTMTEELYAKLARYDEETCVEALREATAGGWKGVYPERLRGSSRSSTPEPRRQTIAERMGITDEEAWHISAGLSQKRNGVRA